MNEKETDIQIAENKSAELAPSRGELVIGQSKTVNLQFICVGTCIRTVKET